MLHRWLNEPGVVRWWEGDDVSWDAVVADYGSECGWEVEHWLMLLHGEPVGWIIENVGPEMLVFASDFPHPEGTSDPIRKFEATMSGCDAETLAAFYRGNIASFMRLEA